MCRFIGEVNDENNRASLSCVAHRIAKVEIVGVVSRIRFSIKAGFVPNGPLDWNNLMMRVIIKCWLVQGFLCSTIYNLSQVR